jgi:hypothetical protein
MSVPNRLAAVGEELVTHRFHTGALGLRGSAESNTGWRRFLKGLWLRPPIPAVCVPPGAKLLLSDIPRRLQHELNVSPCEEVLFNQLDFESNRYRDCIRFRNGKELLLQGLAEGQRVLVLSLADAESGDEINSADLIPAAMEDSRL